MNRNQSYSQTLKLLTKKNIQPEPQGNYCLECILVIYFIMQFYEREQRSLAKLPDSSGAGQASNRGGEVAQLGSQLWSPRYLKVELSTIHTAEHKLVNTLVHTVPGMLPNPDEGHCAEHLQFSHGPFLFLHLCTLSFPKAFICSWFLFSASSLYINICQKLLAQIYPFLKLCSFSKHANLTVPTAFT